MGEITAGLIIVGGTDTEPLLGVTALESVGIEVDPQNQQLKKLPAVRLKGLRAVPTSCHAPAPPPVIFRCFSAR